jgi:hexosaminidase
MTDTDPGHRGAKGWQGVHAFDIGKGAHAMGGEGCLWTEFVRNQGEIDVLAMPRLAALADALWPSTRPSDEDFARRFNAQMPLLDASKVGYYIDPPQGLRPRTVLLSETMVTLSVPPLYRSGTIRYTRDGSYPTEKSPRYRDPLQITDSMILNTALFLTNGRTSNLARAQFVKEKPRPPVAVTRNYVRCTYHEGTYHRLDEVHLDAPGRVFDQPSIALIPQARADHFALICEGFIQVAQTGVYRVDIHADDGLRVAIDGDTVAEIDEERGPRSTDGDIALEAGAHRIAALYFQGTEGKELTIELTGPDGVKRLPNYVR